MTAAPEFPAAPDIAGADPEVLAEVVRRAMGNLEGTPLGMRWEAAKRQQEASRLFAGADRAEHAEQARAAVEAAVARVDEADGKADALAAAVAPAIAAERKAEDRARSFAENARKASEAEQRAAEGGKASAETLTNLILKQDAAAVAAQREQAALEGARAAREQAEAAASRAREDVAARDRELAAAEALADDENPVVAKSDVTLTGDWLALLTAGDLTASELARVRGLVLRYARATGAADVLRGEARRKIEQEERERVSLTPLSRAGDRRALIALPLPARSAR